MSYQNTVTPRFYVDSLNWVRQLGVATPNTGDEQLGHVFGFNPTSQTAYMLSLIHI